MQSTRFNDSQDVWSSKDSQDGSQMLDTAKIQEMIDRHKTTVSLCLPLQACLQANQPLPQVKARRRSVETRLRKAQDDGYTALRRQAETEESAYKEDL
jgi:hypothetical protein